jgi:type III restriction enzyme
MKLQFKHQKFQADAANAVCDIFKGQRLYSAAYLKKKGSGIVSNRAEKSGRMTQGMRLAVSGGLISSMTPGEG